MLGEVFSKGEMLFLMVFVGGLEMEDLSRFGNIGGCPKKHPPKISSPILDSMEEATMDCLINLETRTWNHEMIDESFAPQEADLIKKIPLVKHATTDSVFWPMVEDGQYSCKSGYRFLKEEGAGLSLEAQPD